MKRIIFLAFGGVLILILGFSIGRYVFPFSSESNLLSPFIFQEKPKEYPLLQYQFETLRQKQYLASTITIEKEIASFPEYTSYEFSYTPLNKKMTGQLNLPNEVTSDTPVIVMVRGYVPSSIYSTGVGTRNGAAAFAKAGFITIAPDFFGYGESDPEPDDSWQARFEKPVIVIELIKTIKEVGIPIDQKNFKTSNIGMWGHSNGGQIALSVLEITKESLPTSLWAPVTAPFPYSVLFFSDEDDDEGKGMRLWVNKLEQDYDLSQFSVTHFIDGLRGPIQLHHGTADEAALIAWSDEFLQKVERENDRRNYQREQYLASASESAKAEDVMLQPIEIEYFRYPGADHNLVPSWDTVVARDITFYNQTLK